MNYPKIFFYDVYVEFGRSPSFPVFDKEKFLHFLQYPQHNFLIRVGDEQEYRAVWKELLSVLVPLEAAGGLVHNAQNQFLMIFRRGKWDLPKGKIEKGESPDQAALREIEEEVHMPANALEIKKFITLTYHLYPLQQAFILKTTYWYDVFCSLVECNLEPQIEEDITAVAWLSPSELFSKDTYPSIKSVLETYFQ